MANPYEQFDDPAAAESPTPSSETQAASLSLGDRVVDLARAGVGGVRDMTQAIVQAPLALGEALSPVTDAITGGNPEVTKAAFKEVRSKLSFSEVEEQKTILGGAVRGLTKWMGLSLVAPQSIPASVASVAGRLGAGAAINAGQGFLGTDPQEQNLANLLDEVPQLHGAVTEFLSADKNSSEVMNRLRGAIENVVTGGMVESTMMAFKAIKAARAAGGKEGAKIIAEEGPKIEKAMQKAAAEPHDVSIFPVAEDLSVAQKLPDAGASGPEMVTVYRHGAPTNGAAYFGESESLVAQYQGNGVLHSVELPKAELEKYRAKNLVADPKADPNLIAEAKLSGNPDTEFVLPKDLAAKATEHNGPEGLGTRAILNDPNVSDYAKESLRKELGIPDVQAATTRVADKEALLDRFKVTRSRGEDGVTEPLQGTLNYAKYGDDNSVKQLISDVVATVKKDLPDLAGSYQSHAETRDLARILGKDPVDLYASLSSMRMNAADMAAHVTAGKALIKRQATDLYEVATRLANGQGTDIDKVAFAHMTDVLTSTMDHVSTLRTEAARTTSAGRMRIGMEGITKENYAKLLEKVGGPEAVQALANRIRAAGDEAGVVAAVRGTPSKLAAIHNYIWMNGVLGGAKTFVVNLSTTAFNSGLMPGARVVGGLIDWGLGNAEGREQMLQGLYHYKYLMSTFNDSRQMAAKAFKLGESILDPTANPLGVKDLSGARTSNLLAQDFTGIENEAIGRGVEYLGRLVGLPSKFLIATDEFFKQITYRSHVMAQAHVDGIKQGLDGEALSTFVSSRLSSSIGQAGQGLDDAATAAAKEATFTQDLAAATLRGNRTLSEGIANFSNAHPMVKGLILPFVKVPSNLMRQAWDMTPGLDLLRTQFRNDLAAGGEARAMALGKMGLGTAMWGSAIGLAMDGRITGGGPKDKDLLRQLGPDWKPYSFVFNNDDGTKSYVSFARFDPFGSFFGLAGDIAEMSGKLDPSVKDEAALKLTMGLVKNLSSKTYLRALTDVLDAATGDEKAFKKWFQSRAASYVPGYAQLLNADDELKDIRGWFDGLRSRVPGWSGTLEAKRDNFGEKIMPPMGYPYTAINPFTFYRSTDDPVRKELASLAKDDVEAKFPLPSPTFGPQGSTVDLRDIKNAKGQSAYDRWMELHAKMEVGGQTLHESMAELFASPEYKDARKALGKGDPTYRASLATDLVRKQFDMYEKVTYQQLVEEFPDLGTAMQEFKVGQKTSRVEGSGTAPDIRALRSLAGQQ